MEKKAYILLNFIDNKNKFTFQNESDLLNSIKCGTITFEEALYHQDEVLEQMKKNDIIKKHPFEIYTIERHGKTYYVTYVYDSNKKNHRRQISATTKENLENKIYDDYKNKTLLTFEKVSLEWLHYYKTTVKDTTFDRTMSDYKRFISKCSFLHKSITAIKPIEIKEYLQKTIIDEKLKKRAYSNLKAVLNGIFAFAYDKEYIVKNPMINLKVSTANIVHPTHKTKEEEVFTNKEKDLLRDYIKKDSANYKTTVPYAILLSFQLGLRVGELITLEWSDINFKNNTIHIQRQETICSKYDDNLNKIASSVHEIKEYTKTKAGDRFLPLTPEALKILDTVQSWNKSKKITSDFIFVDDECHRFNRQRINTCLYSYCNKVGIIKKSSHKIRRSVISSLLDNITNKKSVQAFAGHEALETTLNSYYKDISDDNELITGMCACL